MLSPQPPSLFEAVRAGDVGRVEALLAADLDLDARNAEGRTALHDAIEYGQTEIRDLLLDAGASVDICAAAILGDLERVRELLDEDPRRVDDRSTGLTPLGWAAYGNQVAVARELLDRGALLDDGELLCAASVGQVEVGRVLLEHGADPDEIHTGAGGNALHAAVSMRYTSDAKPFVEMLLAVGADPRIPTVKGETALELAEQGARRQARGREEGAGRSGRPRPGLRRSRRAAQIPAERPWLSGSGC